MKKLFSLVALAGMFMLMSFSFKSEIKDPPSEEWIDTVQTVCEEEAINNMDKFDLTVDEAFEWYNSCVSANDC